MSYPIDDARRPSLEEVRGWLDSLSTWGRWGSDDDLGTLNYIGEPERLAAVQLATGAATVSCSARVTFDPGSTPPPGAAVREGGPHADWLRPTRYLIQDGTEAPSPETRFSGYDAFLIAPHGPRVTHLDAPRHTVLRGASYNGIPAGSNGSRGTIEAVGSGIVGRGVLLDVAAARGVASLDDGDAVYPDDLEACEAQAGERVQPGDVIFVRTGYRGRLPNGPAERFASRPGLQAACLPWLHERRVAVVASDVATDVVPHGYEDLGMPVHTVGMWAMGLWLVDNCNLEQLAETAETHRRWSFLAVVSPLVLEDGTGSPVNPLAVF